MTRPQNSQDIQDVRSPSQLSDRELTTELVRAHKLASSKKGDPKVIAEARARASELRAETLYRASRAKHATPEEEDSKILSLPVSEAFHARLVGLARAEEEDLFSLLRRAVLTEADRMERRLMSDDRFEGRADLHTYRNKRRAVRRRKS